MELLDYTRFLLLVWDGFGRCSEGGLTDGSVMSRVQCLAMVFDRVGGRFRGADGTRHRSFANVGLG